MVTGKGGVGKTLIAAAFGRILAASGRDVLLLEADPRENLHHLFDVEPSGGEVVRAGPKLALRNASPRTILDDEVRRRLKLGALSRRVLGSPIYQQFADGAPGLKEMMLLGHALEVTRRRADHHADVVVIDAPASGHGLALLAAPLLVADVITSGPIGDMAGQVAELVADPKRCAIVLATLPEEMAVQETLETAEHVRERLHREATVLIVNAIWPEPPVPLPEGAGFELWQGRHAHQQAQLTRLKQAWRGRSARIPLIGADFGPALLAPMAAALEPWTW